MKILAANYRYFVSSGPERYLFNIEKHLAAAGHEVMPFSISYAKNVPSAFDKYFVSPIGGADEVYFDEHRRDLKTTAKALSRTFYSREVRDAVHRMVDETQPDVAYVLYYLRKLSPALLVGLKQRGVPIVVRISDYGMMCGEHHMLRDQTPCELCLTGSLTNQVRYGCVKGSRAVSLIDAAATTFHRARGYFDAIDHFVTTNDFMTEMMVKSGIARDRITCVPTFTDIDAFEPGVPVEPPYLAYVGRLDEPKGVHLLVHMMRRLRERMGPATPALKIAGTGNSVQYADRLRRDIADMGLLDHVELLGAVPPDEVGALMAGARCLLMPALWYENLPNSVIESFASGCPVIASDIGSLSFTVTDGVDGLLHRSDDVTSLTDCVVRLLEEPGLRAVLAAGARRTAEERHSPAGHIALLENVLRKAHGSDRDTNATTTLAG